MFIDFTKAFNSKYMESSKQTRIEKGWMKVIKKMYLNSKAYIKTDTKGRIFRVQKGVRRGDPPFT